MDKCGTTDLFARISRHPDVVPNIKNKETMWWSWERYGKSSVMQWHSRSFLLLLCIDDQTLKQSWRQIFPHWMKENKQRSAFVALFRNLKLIIQLVFSQTHTTMMFFSDSLLKFIIQHARQIQVKNLYYCLMTHAMNFVFIWRN